MKQQIQIERIESKGWCAKEGGQTLGQVFVACKEDIGQVLLPGVGL